MGAYVVRLWSRLPSLTENIQLLYSDFPVLSSDSLADFHIRIDRPRNLRRWWHPQVLFKIDGKTVFEPFPKHLALPIFEWGMNWCVAKRWHQYLLLHAAVVEKNGRAIIFPAVPGSGKSTLCAALTQRGWRLLSDEFGLVNLKNLTLTPCPRPIPLKNESIEVIRKFAPDATIGPLFPKTRKGTVAHLRPPSSSVARMSEEAQPGWIIFPKFEAGSSLHLRRLPKTVSFLRLANNSFNYEVTGAPGFQAVSGLVRSSECYDFTYGELDDAIARFDSLVS